MARVYNFSAGPSMLPEKVLRQAQAELLEYGDSGQSVMEMSHRSKWFDAIIKDTEATLRRVMNIPDNYKVGFFQGGATQQFAMVPLNFMTTGKADYIVSGNFSGLAAKEAAKFGEAKIVASSKDKNFTYIPDVNAIDYDKDASYIHICQNNTIFGTQFVELPQVEGVPLVADMSSMILSKPVDVSKYGCIYFGVQKNVAPAGMAIAIIRDDLLGHAADNVPTMMNYTTLLAKDSMYNTPPCWCIYMTGLVLKYLENDIGGLANMQKINEAKAKVLYDGGTAVGGTSFFHCLKQKTHSVPPPACRTFFVVLVNNARAQRRSAREGQNSLPASGLASASSAALLLCLPPATQCPQHFFYLPPFLSENDFSALFWRKHIVIFAIPNRMQ